MSTIDLISFKDLPETPELRVTKKSILKIERSQRKGCLKKNSKYSFDDSKSVSTNASESMESE